MSPDSISSFPPQVSVVEKQEPHLRALRNRISSANAHLAEQCQRLENTADRLLGYSVANAGGQGEAPEPSCELDHLNRSVDHFDDLLRHLSFLADRLEAL